MCVLECCVGKKDNSLFNLFIYPVSIANKYQTGLTPNGQHKHPSLSSSSFIHQSLYYIHQITHISYRTQQQPSRSQRLYLAFALLSNIIEHYIERDINITSNITSNPLSPIPSTSLINSHSHSHHSLRIPISPSPNP